MRATLVGLAGAAGAMTRYGIGLVVRNRDFPWATFGINLGGSFLLGLLLASASLREWSPTTTVVLGTGFLGAFTTFSTFSHEVYWLVRSQRPAAAAIYLAGSVVGGVLSAAAGYATARALA